MQKKFSSKKWKDYLPQPVCETFPEYNEFYIKAWELAREHVKFIEGMPQNPYMDEAFCDTQVWIWDACFMSLFCKYAQEVFPGIETFNNFYEVIHNEKELPEVIPTANEPSWTGAVPGQPYHIKVHLADNPPLFAWAEHENALMHGDKEYLRKLLYERKFLQKHYDWLENLKDSVKLKGVMLTTYWQSETLGYKWEGGTSGMDNSPRGRVGSVAEDERPNNPDMLWIDAICQQALSAKMISKMFQLIDDDVQAKAWEEKYLEKKNLINIYYWDKEDKFYYDIDCNDLHFYKVPTIASYWTLTAGIATQERAQIMANYLNEENLFGGEVPFVSLARNDADFVPQGQYWRGGVWLPTAYATLRGLTNYGYHKEAHDLACKLLSHMQKTYMQYEPHTIWESYSPDSCSPGTQTDNKTIVRPDFCGWSALGPISIYLEYILGFHTINAFENVVEWAKPNSIQGKIGVRNLRFGNIVTDIIASEGVCYVKTSTPYTLKINGNAFNVSAGENTFILTEN